MPKQLYKITQFHGGLNSNSDARDIAENELSEATDIMVDELGKIRMMGGISTSSMPDDRTNAITPGYGLFQFSHDRTDGHTAGQAGAETPTDYLAFSDADSTGTVSVYSNQDTTWGEPITGLTNDSGGGRKDNFFYIDGALRISDGNFGNSNDNKWYGFITEKTYADNVNAAEATVGPSWQVQPQNVSEGFNRLGNDNLLAIGSDDFTTEVTMNDAAFGTSRKWGVKLSFIEPSDGANTGSWQPRFNVKYTFWASMVYDGNQESKPAKFRHYGTTYYQTAEGDYLTSVTAANYTDEISFVQRDTMQTLTAIDDYTSPNTRFTTYAAHGYSVNETIQISGNSTSGINGVYIIDAVTSTTFTVETDSRVGSASSPAADGIVGNISELGTGTKLYILPVLRIAHGSGGTNNDFNFDGSAFTSTSGGNERCTGTRIYYSDSTEAHGNLYLLFDIDFVKGIKPIGMFHATGGYGDFKVAHTDHIALDAATAGIENVWEDPPTTSTYQDSNFHPHDEEQYAKFKTAVVTNRMAYIGNVHIDGVTYGDMIIKSPVNQFDKFPKSRALETSVRDGDEIVKLEYYADRLLIFKKFKMELLNISQEIEFLEDTFKHKGVNHPCATIPTDFGIAWVNRQGCYLYDGQEVKNLLEKQGRQIIIESDWLSFTTDNSMIGYLPKKRQLIVLKDCTASSDGDIYLFDMVTQSWVTGTSKFTDDKIQTNFTTDWNGDLVNAHTSGTGTVVKWDDASATSTTYEMQTKDIDFGQPGQLKNIYKVYLTYRGDARNAEVYYGKDGLAPTLTFFTITSGTDGTSTGDSAAAKCLKDAGVTDWLKAELKPSAAISNINSFRLKLSADGSNPIAADFEINDITIVYRLKGQR